MLESTSQETYTRFVMLYIDTDISPISFRVSYFTGTVGTCDFSEAVH